MFVLPIDGARVVLENRVLAAARRMLQLEHRVRIEQVVLAVTAPLVLAARVQLVDTGRLRPIRALVAHAGFLRDDVDANAADTRCRVREEAIDEFLMQTERLEDLRPAIAGQRRDAHLRHHFEDALVERLHVVIDRILSRHPGDQPVRDHVVNRLECEIRIDDAGAVAKQERHVVHFAGVA